MDIDLVTATQGRMSMSKPKILSEAVYQTGKKAVIVHGPHDAAALATFVIQERSAWCEVEPLPDDEYMICYKLEHHKAVLNYCKVITAEDVLAEFVADVEYAMDEETGCCLMPDQATPIEEVWPDLMVTYRKAKAVLDA